MIAANYKRYLVSVRLMTYNQVEFIKAAMESVLMQRTDFDVELVVGDDFSTDGTLETIRSYSGTDRIDIRVLERPVGGEYWRRRSELGRLYNYLDILQNCVGEYIAILDGDDFWSDPYKLQKQVQFLEENPEVVLCAHEVNVLRNGVLGKDTFLPGLYKVSHVISEGRVGHTASYMFRNLFKARWNSPPILSLFGPKIVSGDRALQLILSAKGDIFLMKGPMAVYRKHEQGITNSDTFRSRQYLGMYLLLRNFDVLTDNTYRRLTTPERRKWLEVILLKDSRLINKFRACTYALNEGVLFAGSYLFRLPIYLLKALLFRLKSTWFRHGNSMDL